MSRETKSLSAEMAIWVVQELPPYGEWFTTGYEKFMLVAQKMKQHGISEEHIKLMLKDLYNAVQTEVES